MVQNQSGETVDVILVRESSEMVLGTAPAGRSVFGLPAGTGRTAKFKSRRSRAQPTVRPEFGGPPRPGGVTFTMVCRR